MHAFLVLKINCNGPVNPVCESKFSPGVGRPEVYSNHGPNTILLVVLFGKNAAGHQQEHAEQSHLDVDLVSNGLRFL